MLGKLFSITLTLVTVAAMSAPVAAQVTKLRGGCPGAPYPTPVGSPAIGKAFGVTAAPCRTAAGQPFIVIGTAGPAVTLPAPPACGRGCVLTCNPIVVLLNTGAFRGVIPNNRALIGVQFCVQTGCIEATRPRCINLHAPIGVRITP